MPLSDADRWEIIDAAKQTGIRSVYVFGSVLEEDPENQQAKEIIADIIRTYTRIADSFFDANDFTKATFYYSKAQQVDKDNPHITSRLRLSRQRAREVMEAEQAEAESAAEPETEPGGQPAEGPP